VSLTLIQQELAKRERGSLFNLEKFLFKEQLAFVRDPAPFKTAVCSRRAGKTIACAADLLETASGESNVICLYITLSRLNAKRIIWREIKKINKKFKLGGVPNESELSIAFSNGSFIYCCGAKDRTQIENFRGLAIKKAYLDESQGFPAYIKELIDDVIGPALMDHAGTLSLIGTPGPIPVGYFHECSKNIEWSHYFWTFWQNPHIKNKEVVFERELTRRGVDRENPSIQREWFGKWIHDSESLVYKYDEKVNHFDVLPEGELVYILGVDIGFEDADALAVLCWSEKSPATYLVEEVITTKQGITPLANQIKALTEKYQISKIVADFGGLGKKISEEITRRWHIPIEAADKTQKVANIELMNDALRRGHFLAKRTSRFATDSMLLEWDKEKETPDKKVISGRFHSDILDAALYSFRKSPAYTWSPEPVKPKYGTKEWAKAQTDEMDEKALEYFTKLEEDNKDQWRF
jgi:hypothetical protein